MEKDYCKESDNKNERIRNVCVIAHVDHGKTTLCDSLIATNDIISERMVGQARHMDFREDEQKRGITMVLSAIRLQFNVLGQEGKKDYEINLIDSPGHTDFQSEVISTARLCDGGIVIVDVIEGVCSQTVNVLRQCWVEKMDMILVLNKIDRMFSELKMGVEEAYLQICQIIESLNATLASFHSGDCMKQHLVDDTEDDNIDDSEIYFNPMNNKVIFASSLMGWGFTIETFATMYLKKMKFSCETLKKTLWGDYFLDTKKSIIVKKKHGSNVGAKCLFVSLILEQIWKIYSICNSGPSKEEIESLSKKMGAKINMNYLKNKDAKYLLKTLMHQWIPIDKVLMKTIINHVLNPKEKQKQVFTKFFRKLSVDLCNNFEFDPIFEKSIKECSVNFPEKYTLAYVSKFASFPKSNFYKVNKQNDTNDDGKNPFWLFSKNLVKYYSENNENELSNIYNQNEELVGFTRIFSGSLSKGQKITIVSNNYNNLLKNDSDSSSEIIEDFEIGDLFVVMGDRLIQTETAYAGDVVAINGLGFLNYKNLTISSKMINKNSYLNLKLDSDFTINKSFIKYVISPENYHQFEFLQKGLDLLSRSDPVFEWNIDNDTGEIIISVSGKLHLERCLCDLENKFAKGCKVFLNDPIFPFRESISASKSKKKNSCIFSNYDINVEFEIYPLPIQIVNLLIESENILIELKNSKLSNHPFLTKFKQMIIESVKDSNFFHRISPELFADKIICFGPNLVGPNIFFNSSSSEFPCFFQKNINLNSDVVFPLLNAFELAVSKGPLAFEPMQGILYVINSFNHLLPETTKKNFTNQGLILSLRDCLHNLFINSSPRLMFSMCKCLIFTSSLVLGKVYDLILKRKGYVISEEVKEGFPFYIVNAKIPLIFSTDFIEEIKKTTSGIANPQLIFDNFELLDVDPFWIPNSKEELEALGSFAERENIAKKYIHMIRKKKGLFVDQKLVENAEKQRNMKKN